VGRWLWTYDWPLRPQGGHQAVLVQIDAASLTVTQRDPLDSEFVSLAIAPAGLWVSMANSLVRLDPDSGQVLATVPLDPADGISLLSTDPNGQVIYVAQA